MNAVTTATNHTPRVWIGCLACYNEGRLVGQWFDATEAAEVKPYDIHGAHSRTDSHDELWCFDHENIPTSGELDPLTAARWGELLAEVPEYHREAFSVWALSGDQVEDSDGLPCRDDFEDRYHSDWPSFVSYIEELSDDIGLLADVPEELRGYFDFERYARDCSYDHTVLDAPQGGVCVFTN